MSYSVVSLSAFQMLPGLSNQALKYFLVGVGVLLILWGFERYRTNFSRAEFGVSLVLGIGIISVAILPDAFGTIGSYLNLENRFLVVSLVANSGFAFLILYLLAMIRRNQISINELARSLTAEEADRFAPSSERRIDVVIPAYNEAGTIGSVLEGLPETIRGHTVEPIVVSDSSTDGTAEIAEEAGAIVVELPLNQGQGGALKTGFEIARQRESEVVVTMDADGQHPPEQLEVVVEPILEGTADYVVGSRYKGVDDSSNDLHRRLGIRVFTRIINVMTKADITDCTNGYRAIRGSALEKMTLTEERFSAPELIIEARKNGLRIVEVPVEIQRREVGETKKPTIGYAVGLARTIFVTWIR